MNPQFRPNRPVQKTVTNPNPNSKGAKARRVISWMMLSLVLLVVAAFLALHSINLFTFVFPPDQQQWAWLGFGLTGLGAIGYLFAFLFISKTILQKVISLAMMFICSIGEVLAAFFGMQISSWQKSGWSLAQNDVETMLMVIGILAILHFIALITHFAGDKIIEMFSDEDGDGTPNAFDEDYRPQQQMRPAYNNTPANQNQPRLQGPQNTQTPPTPQHSLDEFLKITGMTREQAKAKYADQQVFMNFASGQFDYISNGNMRRIHGELMGVNGHANPQVGQRR